MKEEAPRDGRIKHVFVLMLENRSFDHVFGLAGISGVDAVTGTPTSIEGLSGEEANDADGARYAISSGAPFAMSVDPGHEFLDVLEQLAGAGSTYPAAVGGYPDIGMSGFASNFAKHAPQAEIGDVLKAFTPAQLPVLNQLAREFCVCDHWFASMPGPTWPNRFFVHAASSAGMDDSPSLASLSDAVLTEGFDFERGTIFDRLTENGVPWLVWEGDELPTVLALKGMSREAFGDHPHMRHLSEFRDAVIQPAYAAAYSFIEPSYGELLFGGHMKCGASMHPIGDVTHGEALVKQVYEVIRNSPHWEESLLIVVFDEHGGFYDHVAPGSAVAPGDKPTDEGLSKHHFDFTTFGVRVPALVISPWVQRNSIDHSVYDHATVVKTICDVFGLGRLTARDGAATSLRHLIESSERPRDDAPRQLVAPAISNVPGCDGGLKGWLEMVWSDITGGASREAPATPLTQAFLHVAARRELEVSPSTSDGQVVDTVRNIQTQAEAAAYIQRVRLGYRGLRRRPLGW
jgi:phospholipase C